MKRIPLVRLLIAAMVALAMSAPALVPATAQGTDAGSSPSNPIPLDTTGTVGDFEVTVLNVMPDALDYIMAYNEFNSEPEPGTQFFLTRIQVTYIGDTSGSPWTDLSFSASTGASEEEEEPYTDWGYSCGDIPESSTTRSNELFTGGTIEFNVCWAIAEEDAGSIIMLISPTFSFDGTDDVWFSLGNAPMATPEPSVGLKPGVTDLASSRTEPLPIGTSSVVGEFSVEVVSVEPDALDLIVNDQSFNDPPAEGNQFYLVTVSVTNNGEETLTPWWDLSFYAVGDQAIGYTESANSCGYIPNAAFEAPELDPGDSAEFNVCWQVPTAEAPSLVMYVDSGYSPEERTWFAIQP